MVFKHGLAASDCLRREQDRDTIVDDENACAIFGDERGFHTMLRAFLRSRTPQWLMRVWAAHQREEVFEPGGIAHQYSAMEGSISRAQAMMPPEMFQTSLKPSSRSRLTARALRPPLLQ